jgi:predicted patatin/cPLA2 family phospholipase
MLKTYKLLYNIDIHYNFEYMNKISNISHIILSGGGGKGMAYLGILRYLHMEGMLDKLKYIAGTSMGAFFALVFALRIPSEIIEESVEEVRASMPINSSISKHNFPNLFTHNGMISIYFILKPLTDFIKQKYGVDDLSFIEFVKKTGVNLYIRAINVNTTKVHIFSLENTPNVSVIDACAASMSIPFIFKPVVIDGEYYVDSVLCDFQYFKDVDKENILGIMLPVTEAKLKQLPKGSQINLFEFSMRVSQLMIANMMNDEGVDDSVFQIGPLIYDTQFRLKVSDKDIYIDLTKEELDALIVQGFVYMSQYMQKRYEKRL